VIFQEFPGPGIFKKKSRTSQNFPGDMETLIGLYYKRLGGLTT